MGHDPEKHHRQSIRMKGYDYTLPGAYFVTIVSLRRMCLFGGIENGTIIQSDIGRIVNECWYRIPNCFEDIELDEFVLMPNHLHGLVLIYEALGKGEAFAESNLDQNDNKLANASPLQPKGTRKGSLSAVIQNFKSISTRLVNKKYFTPGNKIWQRNYYERIIRNDREFSAIRQYIHDNPLNWEMDQENPEKI
jgi:putative transposase